MYSRRKRRYELPATSVLNKASQFSFITSASWHATAELGTHQVALSKTSSSTIRHNRLDRAHNAPYFHRQRHLDRVRNVPPSHRQRHLDRARNVPPSHLRSNQDSLVVTPSLILWKTKSGLMMTTPKEEDLDVHYPNIKGLELAPRESIIAAARGRVEQDLGRRIRESLNTRTLREESRTMEAQQAVENPAPDEIANDKKTIRNINEKLDIFMKEQRSANQMFRDNITSIINTVDKLPGFVGAVIADIPKLVQNNVDIHLHGLRVSGLRPSKGKAPTTIILPVDNLVSVCDLLLPIRLLVLIEGREAICPVATTLHTPSTTSSSSTMTIWTTHLVDDHTVKAPQIDIQPLRIDLPVPSLCIALSARRSEFSIPMGEDPTGTGMFHDGKNYMFVDVFGFQERLMTFLENPLTSADNENQLLTMFHTLIAGPALIWWTNELNPAERNTLLRGGIIVVLTALKERFLPNVGKATSEFLHGGLTLKDIAQDDQALINYVQRQLRLSRIISNVSDSQENWFGTMSVIYQNMEQSIQEPSLQQNTASIAWINPYAITICRVGGDAMRCKEGIVPDNEVDRDYDQGYVDRVPEDARHECCPVEVYGVPAELRVLQSAPEAWVHEEEVEALDEKHQTEYKAWPGTRKERKKALEKAHVQGLKALVEAHRQQDGLRDESLSVEMRALADVQKNENKALSLELDEKLKVLQEAQW
ncbi:hypothetical protein B0H66DRAFT_526533 [Apodospora peruviana]|uniref:Uncharacterized protein n=1 Tax=Apodospora peruviana TaxID=516989 RepID=A0AAE0IQ98_9PEZI|nr:hypothetical protein B0H66DRAFT_526533 [Apodospora peruviana]